VLGKVRDRAARRPAHHDTATFDAEDVGDGFKGGFESGNGSLSCAGDSASSGAKRDGKQAEDGTASLDG
jgi:hypothetical protein